ncbi:MAG: N-acetyltransferase [Phycisphaeraceae bacterium]|nr:N-acetyltransferase [Phycisphaeraceae bacterium]
MADDVVVELVRTRSDRRTFRLLPHRLYADDPHWVAPLNLDVKAFLSGRHPYYENGEIAFYLARRGGEVVGRIAAIENRTHNEQKNERGAFFGFFETIDDRDVSRALFDQVAAWARERDLDSLRGPTSPSLNYESGLLVTGEPGPPVLMMPHNPLWYADHVEAHGFRKEMDLDAFWLDREIIDLDRWDRLSGRILARNQVTTRLLDMSRFEDEVRLVMDIFNDAWSENWGFVPLSQREFDALAKELKQGVHPGLGSFLVREGREIGFWIGLPDYNRILIELKGRLLPFGWLKLLRAKRRLDAMRVLLMGVRKEHQHLGLDSGLYANIVKQGFEHDIHGAECSWILETNKPMANTLTRVGARKYRSYRIFRRVL